MAALDLDVEIGTNSDDDFNNIAAYSLSIGLRGNDTFVANSLEGFTLLLGGDDNDTYIVNGSALVFDTDGADTYQLPNINLDDAYIVTIDNGRHVLVHDPETDSSIFLIDVDSSAAQDDWIQFGDFGLWLDDFVNNVENLNGFIEDINWVTLGIIGLPGIPNGTANDTLDEAFDLAFNAKERADVSEIALLYEASLDRIADIGGFNFWIDVFEGGWTFKDIAEEFLDNPEFAEKFGDIDTLSAAEYIDRLYQNVLGREADQGGLDFWEGQIDKGLDYADLLLEFAESDENVAQANYLDFLEEVAPGVWDWV